MTLLYHHSRQLGIAATLWLGFVPATVRSEQPEFITAAPPTRSTGQTVESDAVHTAGTSDDSTGSQCGNFGLAHRWQYHWKPSLIEKYSGTSQTRNVRPFGMTVRGPIDLQVNSGIAAQMVLYKYDFEGEVLNRRGQRQAVRVSEFARMISAPIVIEPSGNDALDRARQLQVVEFLHQAVGFPNDLDAVVINFPWAIGLAGEDARLINQSAQQQVQSGGATYLNTPAVNRNNGSQNPSVSSPGTGATSIR